MSEAKILLTDEQMAEFITYGYLKLNTDFPAEFHQSVLQKMNEVYKNEGNPGNNLLPRIPEIGQFFEHPVVSGALTSILGPEYIMSPHRHGHLTKVGTGQVGWHKDNYWLNEKIRNHHPWSVIIFYYTQDVTEEMGPSALMPGTQNYYHLPSDGSEITFKVTGKAGSMALIAYDLWHTATQNQSDIDRYMLKFQFFRLEAPKSPTWNNKRSHLISPRPLHHLNEHRLMWEHEWNWLSGCVNDLKTEKSSLLETADQENERIRQLAMALKGEVEKESLNAAYELAAIGSIVPTLIEALYSPVHYVACNAAHGLIVIGEKAIPALLEALRAETENDQPRGYIAFVLGELGEAGSEAVPALIEQLQDKTTFVRQHTVEALGLIQRPASLIVPALCHALLYDPDNFTRYTAALALARVGKEAVDAVPSLDKALSDPYRYVPALASEALARIRTDEALDVLLPFLKKARWCPSTTTKSTF